MQKYVIISIISKVMKKNNFENMKLTYHILFKIIYKHQKNK